MSQVAIEKVYRGITDANCLLWCHGTEGVSHRKVRRFRYPMWKYVGLSHRVVMCVCLDCNMKFYGELASDTPLNIPVAFKGGYFADNIPVTVNGRMSALKGEIVRPFRRITQDMLTTETRAFIELVQ